MTDPNEYNFVPQTNPPADRAATTYWFAFQDQKMIVRTTGKTEAVPLLSDLASFDLNPIRWQYLGYLENGRAQPIHCYSAEIDPSVVLTVAWARTHQYCGQCGAPTETLTLERSRRCPACGLTSYPRISPAIIIAVVRRDEHGERILLARNHRFPPGRFSVVAGFVEPGESLEECARREVFEEVGLHIKNIHYFASQPWPFPNSLMVGFTAEYEDGEITLEESELADAGWFTADNLPNLPPRMTIARKLIDWFVGKSEVHSPPSQV